MLSGTVLLYTRIKKLSISDFKKIHRFRRGFSLAFFKAEVTDLSIRYVCGICRFSLLSYATEALFMTFFTLFLPGIAYARGFCYNMHIWTQ